jgi:EAL domain-containing protein (putative c-di-GMP-specific phosphodiesterase class I)/GGDEF domain-containing protein
MSGGGGRDDVHRLRAEYLRLKSALQDRNTGLSSFHAHFPGLRSHFEHVRSVGVVVVGLGDLSQVEAIYGWQVFDRLLRRVGEELEALRAGLLPQGSLLAMDGISAGRFVLFVPRDRAGEEVSPAYLEGLANSLRVRLEECFAGEDFRSMTPRLRFELGHSLLQDDPFFRFERQVYRAVEAARRAGAGPYQGQRSREEEELRRILREGEIRVVFQPIHSLENGEVLGYEALSRGPEDGPFRDPQVMFETSRSVGLATELDALCQRRAILGAHGLEPGRKLFVNALPSTLADPAGGAEPPVEWIDRAGLRRRDVVIEISERGPLVDRARVHEELGRLREAGLGIALDDVGTGLTGVDTLEEMRPDYLKLDVSLVHNIHTNLVTQELLRSLNRVARSMSARVVGEGVETEQERETLRRCGTDLAQGFLFARPGPHLGAGAAP